MVRPVFLVSGALLALAACGGPQVPDSGAGVGFGDYASYEVERARREAMLAGDAPLTGPAPQTIDAGGPAITSQELSAVGIGQATQSQTVQTQTAQTETAAPVSGRAAAVQAQPGNAAPVLVNNPGISDEQDFNAVSSRESIESDAERRAAQIANYQVIGPEALPERTGNTGPNIVAFALQTSNAKGQAIYSRSLLSGQARFQRNCARYRSPDEAQRDFLSRGGPQRDPRGIDPDGDGFACGWDPTPFRQVARN